MGTDALLMDANALFMGTGALLKILQIVRSAGGASHSDYGGEMVCCWGEKRNILFMCVSGGYDVLPLACRSYISQ